MTDPQVEYDTEHADLKDITTEKLISELHSRGTLTTTKAQIEISDQEIFHNQGSKPWQDDLRYKLYDQLFDCLPVKIETFRLDSQAKSTISVETVILQFGEQKLIIDLDCDSKSRATEEMLSVTKRLLRNIIKQREEGVKDASSTQHNIT